MNVNVLIGKAGRSSFYLNLLVEVFELDSRKKTEIAFDLGWMARKLLRNQGINYVPPVPDDDEMGCVISPRSNWVNLSCGYFNSPHIFSKEEISAVFTEVIQEMGMTLKDLEITDE